MLALRKKKFSLLNFFVTQRPLIDEQLADILADEKRSKALFEAIDKLKEQGGSSASAKVEDSDEEIKIETVGGVSI
jgi:hypothetical protein